MTMNKLLIEKIVIKVCIDISIYIELMLKVQQYLKNVFDKKFYVCADSVSQFNEDCNNVYGMSPKQIILFKQQLTQHVQLLTQNYILCTMTANLKKNCPKLINLLVCILILFTNISTVNL